MKLLSTCIHVIEKFSEIRQSLRPPNSVGTSSSKKLQKSRKMWISKEKKLKITKIREKKGKIMLIKNARVLPDPVSAIDIESLLFKRMGLLKIH